MRDLSSIRDDSRPIGRSPSVLATDLDGTLIPLSGHSQNRADLQHLSERLASSTVTVVFVTGRHLAIVEEAITEHQLPIPDWIICDVGTTLCQWTSGTWQLSAAYADHLGTLCAELPMRQLRRELSRFSELVPQEDDKQGPYKLSYYVSQSELESHSGRVRGWLHDRQAPYSLISSVDPFTGDGLIDLLPSGVSKAYAVEWWRNHSGFDRNEIVFAGDSGNDWAALTGGYLTIVVGNADPALSANVARHHQQHGITDRLHLARAHATSGVLEGCCAFGLFDDQARRSPAER